MICHAGTEPCIHIEKQGRKTKEEIKEEILEMSGIPVGGVGQVVVHRVIPMT